MRELLEAVGTLVEEEYARASEKYGATNHTDHESYAILLEECEEAEQESRYIRHRMEELWKLIKHDMADSTKRSNFMSIEHYAKYAACEFIQVAAMAKKAMLTIDGRGGR